MNDRDIALQMIADGKAMIDAAESKLAEIDKPKLRHGDYGYGGSTGYAFFIKGNGEQASMWGEHQDRLNTSDSAKTGGRYRNAVLLGNIYDDLKRNSEDLTKFEVSGQYDTEEEKTVKAKIGLESRIWLHISTNSSYFNIDTATELHQKLGQLIATARRKQK
jgi:hypothetical protein